MLCYVLHVRKTIRLSVLVRSVNDFIVFASTKVGRKCRKSVFDRRLFEPSMPNIFVVVVAVEVAPGPIVYRQWSHAFGVHKERSQKKYYRDNHSYRGRWPDENHSRNNEYNDQRLYYERIYYNYFVSLATRRIPKIF